MPPVPVAAGFPAYPSLSGAPRSKQRHRLHNWSSLGQSHQRLGKTLKAPCLLCLWLPASRCTWHYNPCITGTSRVPAIQATTPPPQLGLTGAEMKNARKNPNRTTSLVPGAAPLHTRHFQGPYWPCSCTTSMSGPWWDRPPASRLASAEILMDDPQAEVGIKPQLSSRDRVAKEMCSYLQEDFSILTHSHKLLTS